MIFNDFNLIPTQALKQYWNQQNYDQAQQAFAVEKMQQAYSNLVASISNTGYAPTDAELAAAGMTREEANRWANYYAMNNAATGGSGGTGGRRSSGGGGGNPTADDTSPADTIDASAAAGAYAATHSGYIDDGATQAYMDSLGLSGQARQTFVDGLIKAGWDYTWNTKGLKDYWANRNK